MDGSAEECDYWVVYESIDRTTTCRCPPEHTVFVTGEPPSIRLYNPLFLRNFHTVITCHPNLIHRNVVRTQPSLPWMIGMSWNAEIGGWERNLTKSYDELKALEPRKDRTMSMISSDKAQTKGHRLRLDFVKRLEKELGGELGVFLTTDHSLKDKWEAIGRYRYHICLENYVCRDYWTEKLADAVLGLSYPVYHGCPNLGDYFPSGSFRRIDLRDPEGAVKVIREILDSSLRDDNLVKLKESRNRILDEHNLFPSLARVFDGLPSGSRPRALSIRPETRVYTHNLRTIAMGLGGTVRDAIVRK